MQRRSFRAMGTEIELLVDARDADRALAAAHAEFQRLETVLSRFRPDSELTELNRRGRLEAGHDLRRVVELALEARERTGGRFDPTIHDALLAAGYDRTFADVCDGELGEPKPGGGEVRVVGRWIVLAAGVRLDLGGIGKGYTAERTAELLATAGPCLVNAGGDIAVRGGSWPVGVEDVTLELTRGGLATSGRDRRRWRRGGREMHHLIDPRTGTPAETDLLRVTAVGSDAVDAEVLAKALFLAGFDEAVRAGVPAILVAAAGGRPALVGGLS
jgi:FAD:protein FMN transferase